MMTKGDRVVIRHPDAGPLFHDAHGIVTWAREKRPRGKTPGLWVNIRIDPRPGLKKAEIEIHSDHVQLEVTTRPYAGEQYPHPCPSFGAEHTMEGFTCDYCDGHGAGYDKAVSLGKRGRDVLDLAIRENTRMKRVITGKTRGTSRDGNSHMSDRTIDIARGKQLGRITNKLEAASYAEGWDTAATLYRDRINKLIGDRSTDTSERILLEIVKNRLCSRNVEPDKRCMCCDSVFDAIQNPPDDSV